MVSIFIRNVLKITPEKNHRLLFRQTMHLHPLVGNNKVLGGESSCRWVLTIEVQLSSFPVSIPLYLCQCTIWWINYAPARQEWTNDRLSLDYLMLRFHSIADDEENTRIIRNIRQSRLCISSSCVSTSSWIKITGQSSRFLPSLPEIASYNRDT